MTPDFRIGLGHDIHALVEGRDLWLGGVQVPYHLGLKGHSDADALIHAIMDAMLGALAMGDIGGLFPDNDSRFKDISSVLLLREVVKL
ncbi:MAG: 2-C-methyl-D-erythritol 2,4-cyclodiphosphate synthase, partial [Candidatus Riflebacteria bacterium]|nr:2-C-methyl-D-erythritol 2,4-cyclodiphosphate synthase [Candidatus Riflebacteria bacterium]